MNGDWFGRAPPFCLFALWPHVCYCWLCYFWPMVNNLIDLSLLIHCLHFFSLVHCAVFILCVWTCEIGVDRRKPKIQWRRNWADPLKTRVSSSIEKCEEKMKNIYLFYSPDYGEHFHGAVRRHSLQVFHLFQPFSPHHILYCLHYRRIHFYICIPEKKNENVTKI